MTADIITEQVVHVEQYVQCLCVCVCVSGQYFWTKSLS